MSTFKVYIRWNGHVEAKYESASSALDACCQAVRYFKNGSIVHAVQVKESA